MTDEVVHRLKWDLSDRRIAVCGAEENTFRGERLNFTIEQQYVENCPECIVVDTGADCPSRRRWWHRKPRPHVGDWRSLDMGNCRTGPCRFCGRSVQQRLRRTGHPVGPWVDDVWIPCTHGRSGGPVQACISCSNDRGARGLYR